MDTRPPTHRFHAILFGAFTLRRGTRAARLPASARARALLAYLLLHRAQPHPRAVLVGQFFPELPEDRARRALTQALWHVRRVLPRLIQADADTIHIPPDAPIWVDVEEFRKYSVFSIQYSELPSQSPISNLQPPISNLQSLISLYRGDLLEGFYDDWALLERERLREMYLHALERLIQWTKSTSRYQDALTAALKLTTADPLRESAQREVMRLYFLLDRPEAALKQFAACRDILNAELALEPAPETVALAQEIAQRSGVSATAYLPSPQLPLPLALEDARAAQIPLVGRADERAQLIAHVEALGAGSGGIVLLEGEAGVGKTRLLQEIARDAAWRGAQVLWGRCNDLEAASPYAPMIDALAQGLSPLRAEQLRGLLDPIWLQVLAPLLPNLAAAPSAPAALEPTPARARLIEAFAQLIAAWAHITPLVLMVEDLHWADDDTLDLLAPLARRLREERALLVGTYRGEDARVQPALWDKLQALDRAGLRSRLELKRLDATATSELIRRALGLAHAAPRFEDRLYHETAGNPLFVLETLRTLYDEGLLAPVADGQWRTPWDETTRDYAEMPLPPAVERVIARRATQLSAHAQHVLRAAAILGSDLNFALVSRVGELASRPALDALSELVRRRFLEETPDAYRFTHDKVRQVIYAAIAEPERREWHRRAGAALEKSRPDATPALAFHFFVGQEWARAARYGRQAGDQAARVYAQRDAANHYTRALQA
ncbi:MAG: AAA family ATPase, partial [Chloroflexota bacterium]